MYLNLIEEGFLSSRHFELLIPYMSPSYPREEPQWVMRLINNC